MGFLFPLVFILFLALGLRFASRRSMMTTIPVAVACIPLLPYASGLLFNNLSVGYFAELVLCLLAVIFAIKWLIKNARAVHAGGTGSTNVDIFKQWGVYLFLVIYCLIYVHDFRGGFLQWDEFSHWGMMLKELLRADTFYSAPDSLLMVHRDYPPYATVFEYVYCRLSGGYSETYALRAMHILEFSMCMLPLQNISRRLSIRANILVTITIPVVLALVLCQSNLFNTVYVDLLFGVQIAVCVWAAVFLNYRKLFDCFTLTVLLSSMLLTKQMGIAFFVLTVFILAVRIILDYGLGKKHNRESIRKRAGYSRVLKNVFCILLVIVPPVALSRGWSFYIAQFDVTGQFNLSDLSLPHIVSVFSGEGIDAWRIEGFWNLIAALSNNQLMGSAPFVVSYWRVITLASLALVLFCLLLGRGKTIKPRSVGLLLLSIVVGGAGYALALALSYTFGFSEWETTVLASWDRYSGTYAIAVLLLVTFVVLRVILELESFGYQAAGMCMVLIIALLFLPSANFEQLKFDAHGDARPEQNDAQVIMNNTEENSETLILSEQYADGAEYFIGYYAFPRRLNETNLENTDRYSSTLYYAFPDNYKDMPSINTGKLFDEATAKAMIAKYDYLYVYSIDSETINAYQDLFPSDVSAGDIYRVFISDGDVHLLKQN